MFSIGYYSYRTAYETPHIALSLYCCLFSPMKYLMFGLRWDLISLTKILASLMSDIKKKMWTCVWETKLKQKINQLKSELIQLNELL